MLKGCTKHLEHSKGCPCPYGQGLCIVIQPLSAQTQQTVFRKQWIRIIVKTDLMSILQEVFGPVVKMHHRIWHSWHFLTSPMLIEGNADVMPISLAPLAASSLHCAVALFQNESLTIEEHGIRQQTWIHLTSLKPSATPTSMTRYTHTSLHLTMQSSWPVVGGQLRLLKCCVGTLWKLHDT